MLFFCIRFVQNLRLCLIINTYIIMENKDKSTKEKKIKFILRIVAWCSFAISIVMFIIGINLDIKWATNCDPYFVAMGVFWLVAFVCNFADNT